MIHKKPYLFSEFISEKLYIPDFGDWMKKCPE